MDGESEHTEGFGEACVAASYRIEDLVTSEVAFDEGTSGLLLEEVEDVVKRPSEGNVFVEFSVVLRGTDVLL